MAVKTMPTLSNQRICEHCESPAEFTDSVPDASLPGINAGECGYRTIYLCTFHAEEHLLYCGNTSRIKHLGDDEILGNIENLGNANLGRACERDD